MQASQEMQKYFDHIQKNIMALHGLAAKARKKGFDPEEEVEVKLAKNMAERVVGLISVIAPQIVDSGVVERIIELEKEHGTLDWRVALKVAEEISQEKFCKFKNQEEAISVGIRAGFTYVTVGVVSAPLEGIATIDFKERMDKRGKYMSLSFAGPIRNAGGTAAAVSMLIADYVRKKFKYDVYDVQEEEIKRTYTEMQDYRDRVAPRQYFPDYKEVEFIMKNLPIEVAGEPSEKFEVSNYKDLPRVPTNNLRSGFCLMMTECIPLKAPKLWKQLAKWGKDFDMEQWNFIDEFLKMQKEIKAKGSVKTEKKDDSKIKPDFSYIKDLVAGRPIFTHPLRTGGFRLRYGRSRASGYSTCAVHPATMAVTNNYLATGTQLKIERPSKGTAITSCNTIDGPIVKLKNGKVMKLASIKQVKEVQKEIEEILFLGDFLVSYGDFLDRAHPLIPAGYCEEWWVQELEKATIERFGTLDIEKLAELTEVPADIPEKITANPLTAKISAKTAINISKKLGIPLHPEYTYYWSTITLQQLIDLIPFIKKARAAKDSSNEIEKLIIPLSKKPKRVLEILGVPHETANNEYIVVHKNHALALVTTLNVENKNTEELNKLLDENKEKSILHIINMLSEVKLKDKAGIFIGARMGRPEKAKMRKMTGSPHGLFPVGKQGGKFRCFQSALDAGKINSDLPVYYCAKCKKETILLICEECERKTKRRYYCKECKQWQFEPECKTHGENIGYKRQDIDIKKYFNYCLKKLGMRTYPDLIKGVRGTSNRDHTPEHLAKAILRAKHDIFVNKDGTVRYDMTQMPITHFKPAEIATPVAKLKELGYDKDINGKELTEENQVLEIKPQDVILPACDPSPDQGADEVLFKTANFIDDVLVNLYGLPPFYKITKPQDIVGHLIVALAPHTSAGMAGRVIGFSKTQGFFAHPYLHAATRRDCDGDEACFVLVLDAFLNFSRKYLPSSRGATMDAPLVLTSVLLPGEVDDMAFQVDIPWKYPLDFYEATQEYKMPWEFKIKTISNTLGKPEQYEKMGFTHNFDSMNNTVRCSSYKLLPSMKEKLAGQMDLAEKIRAVDQADVARLVIERHFLKDTKGNLRKFSMQSFRCVNCNQIYRRPPLAGKCLKCNGKIIFTISEGSIIKYLQATIDLINNYKVSKYLKQTIELLQKRIEDVFGKEKEKQTGIGEWC
ncbi:DNA polymerase II large subunit [Candidatus Woesearchaeota archaeon]|nr:DNA polymerase II large subunit [Candidatus Woesearchaeota archaeon]